MIFASEAIGFLLFGVAHWMWGFKYFSVSRQMPFKLANEEVPKKMIKCQKITNWIFLTLNCIAPMLFGIGAIRDLSEISEVTGAALTPPLEFISGIFLVCALCKIKSVARSQGNSQINTFAMTLHATAFGLYLASWLLIFPAFYIGNYEFVSLGLI